MALRFRKLFPKDMGGSTTQKDLSGFNRIGVVQQVDPIHGTCVVKWLDHPGIRFDVIITQATAKEWYVPEKGSIVLVEFDQYERARIVRYMNLGQASRIQQSKSLPKLKEGERMWEVGGTYLYMKRNGDVVIETLNQGILTIDSASSTFKTEFVNWNNVTDAGSAYLGIVQRLVPDLAGNASLKNIVDDIGEIYSELHFQVLEFANGGVSAVGTPNPIADIVIGTAVDSQGNIIAKNGLPSASYTKQISLSITMNNTLTGVSNVSLLIDKEGRITLNSKSLNYNKAFVDASDPDVALGLEVTNPTLGTRGQHVAREHDLIKIPLSTTYVDPEHATLADLAANNQDALQWLAQSFISPTGPCTFNPALIPANTDIRGQIASGSANLYAGDS